MPANLIQNLPKNEKAGASALYIYDAISTWFGISSIEVVDALKDFKGDSITVYINSPGGDVFEARAISSALKRLSADGVKVTAVIDGLCASAATMIALACDEVHMNDGCQFMIHEASGVAVGTKNEIRAYADLCEKVEQDIVQDYVAKTGISADEILAMMEAETWMSADEAFEKGFIDHIVGRVVLDDKEPEPEPEPEKEEEEIKDSVGQRNANRLKLLLAV